MTTATAQQAPRADLPLADSFRPRGDVRGPKRGKFWRAAVLIAVHVGFVAHFAHWKVAGETLTPMEPSEAMETLELGYVNAGFLVLGISILLTAIFGRFFCGWLCHFVAYQDFAAWLLGRVGLRPRPVRSRLLALVPLGAAFYMFLWPTVRRWWEGGAAPHFEWEMQTTRFWETFPGPGIAILTVVVGGFFVVWWLGSKGFCSYGCPYGAFFGLADRIAPGRIRVTDACSGCGHCTAVCSSNVRVHEEVGRYRMVVDSGCMKTMDCVHTCPNDALYFGFGAPALGSAKKQKARRAFDFSWGEELAMAGAFVAALVAFRSAYNLVPFLLAIALGITASVAVVTLGRLLRLPDVRFQGVTLRAAGRLTAPGRGALAASALFLALTAHTGHVRWLVAEGEEVALSTRVPYMPQDERRARLDESFDLLTRAESRGLVADSALQKMLGLVQRDRGEAADAEARLRRALELHPHTAWPAAAIPLADMLARQRRAEEAEAVLRAVLAERPEIADAGVLLAGALTQQQRFDDAAAALEDVLARHPGHPGATRMLDAVQRMR
jgi:ferredoxin-type protein NapH